MPQSLVYKIRNESGQQPSIMHTVNYPTFTFCPLSHHTRTAYNILERANDAEDEVGSSPKLWRLSTRLHGVTSHKAMALPRFASFLLMITGKQTKEGSIFKKCLVWISTRPLFWDISWFYSIQATDVVVPLSQLLSHAKYTTYSVTRPSLKKSRNSNYKATVPSVMLDNGSRFRPSELEHCTTNHGGHTSNDPSSLIVKFGHVWSRTLGEKT
jgi:hypothetical protein